MNQEKEQLLALLSAFYAKVDAHVGALSKLHKERMQCKKGCSACCIDGLTVSAIEAQYILEGSQSYALQGQSASARGTCAFLDPSGACRIYERRPYVCRTQGVPMSWKEQKSAKEWLEWRDICPLNAEGTPVEELSENQCFPLLPYDEYLAQLSAHWDQGQALRLGLRSLFQKLAKED